MHCENTYKYNICSEIDIDQDVAAELLRGLESNHNNGNKQILGGRGEVRLLQVRNLGRVVVKNYRRGGVFSIFINRYYLRLGKTRPQLEYELMKTAGELGISAPKPIAYVTKGRLFYQGWLVSNEVSSKKNLATVSLENKDLAMPLTVKVIEQITKLIKHKIYHIDLHPGNVLVDSENEIVIVDFDKAKHFKGTRNKLRDLYLCRWRRAVIKHSLPEFLSELVCAGIRRNFD